MKSLQSHIGYVPQAPFIIPGSIKDNIAYPEIGDNTDKIMTAAKQSQSHEFIEKLPDGYNTFIGERGQKLSEGQKLMIDNAMSLKNI